MFGGMDPRKMQALMKQMGIKQEEIPAAKVIIEKEDSTKIVISNPSVTKINMQGQESWQITGTAKEESQGFSEADIQTIMQQTHVSHEKAKAALEKTGDLAEAILELSE